MTQSWVASFIRCSLSATPTDHVIHSRNSPYFVPPRGLTTGMCSHASRRRAPEGRPTLTIRHGTLPRPGIDGFSRPTAPSPSSFVIRPRALWRAVRPTLARHCGTFDFCATRR